MNYFWGFLIISISFGSVAEEENHGSRIPTIEVDQQENHPIVPHSLIFEDINANYKPEEIFGLLKQQNFKRITNDVASFGFTKSAFWFLFNVKIPEDLVYKRWYISVEYPQLDFITLYRVNDTGSVEKVKTLGDHVAFSERDLDHRYFYFELKGIEQSTFLMRIETSGSNQVPLFLRTLSDIFRTNHNNQMAQGIYIGLMLIMATFYLLLFFGSKRHELEYLYYSNFIFSAVFFSMALDGITTEYIWGGNLWLTNNAPRFFVPYVFFSALPFCIRFLEIDNQKVRTTFNLFTFALGSMCIINFLIPYRFLSISIGLGLLSVILIILSAAKSYLDGFAPARLFLISWSMILMGAMLYGSQKLGWIPVSVFTKFGFEIGAAAQSLFLALALVEKINRTQQQIEKAQKRAFDAEKKSNHLITKMNVTLENEVQLKTEKLSQRNAELNLVLDSIQQGICRIDGDFIIVEVFSEFISELTNRRQVTGESFEKIILNQCDYDAESMKNCRDLISTFVGEDIMNFEANTHILPRHLSYLSHDSSRMIEFDWLPIANTQNQVIDILVVMRDVTQRVEEDKRIREQQTQIELMETVLTIGVGKFKIFLEDAIDGIKRIDKTPKHEDAKISNLNHYLRIIHTIKGNSRTYGLKSISSLIHEIESHAFEIKHDPALLSQYIQDSKETLYERFHNIKNLVLARFPETNPLDQGVHFEIYEYLAAHMLGSPASRLAERLKRQLYVDFSSLLTPIKKSLPELCHHLGKPLPQLEIVGKRLEIYRKHQTELEGVFTHIIRNSLDHGIQSDGQAKITIVISREQNYICLRIIDSGLGLHLEKMQQINPDLVNASDEVVAQQVFTLGYTSKDFINDISGRGIGMHAVQSTLGDLGGEIDISFTAEKHRGFRQFAWLIRFLVDNSILSITDDENVVLAANE